MTREDFIQAYVISAIAGTANSKGMMKPWEVIEDAEAMWAEIDTQDSDKVLAGVEDVRSKRNRATRAAQKVQSSGS